MDERDTGRTEGPETWDEWPRKDEEADCQPVRRKRQETARVVDFHGLTAREALRTLENLFLGPQRPRGTFILVHGVGRHSPEGRQVLKPLVREWVRKHGNLFRKVRPGHPGEGGAGVTVVEVK